MTPFSSVPLTNMKLSISYPILIQTNQLDLIVCIPIRILQLLKNDISTQLSGIFNVSFSTGVPTHKKQSKLVYSITV